MGHKDILKKLFKKGGVMSSEDIAPVMFVATPSPSVNWAMGGGIPLGRLVCLEGPPSGGKSMFTAACVGNLLRQDPDGESVVFWYDAELSYSPHWQKIFMSGIDPSRLVVIPKNQAGDIFDHFYSEVVSLIENDGLKVAAVVIDSLQSIVAPKEANKKNSTASVYAALAGYLPGALRMILEPIRRFNIPLMVVSQVRANMDANAAYTGEKYTIGGGLAWKHAMDIEVEFSAIEGKKSKILDDAGLTNVNETDIVVGHRIRMKVKKNKVSVPLRVAEFDLNYTKGIVNTSEEIARLGASLGIITLEGNTYSFNGQKLAVGLPKTLEVIASSQAIQEAITAEVSKRG